MPPALLTVEALVVLLSAERPLPDPSDCEGLLKLGRELELSDSDEGDEATAGDEEGRMSDEEGEGG